MQRLEHPNPYHVSWVKDENKILVSEQCIVKLKIGPFNDEVLCDIMPMDCFHILLGRPWNFDINFVYDGILNQYTTWKNGVKFTLLLLIKTLDEMSCNVRVCMVSGKEFEDMKKSPIYFSIIPRETSYSSSDRVIESNDRVVLEIQRLL